jgi:molecular chaperone GrpE
MAWGRKDSKRPEDDVNAQGEPDIGVEGQEHHEPVPGDIAGPGDGSQPEIARLQAERDEANQKYLRSVADYQNFARRAAASEKEAKLQGITAIVLNVIPIIDHFDLALGQDPSKVTAEQIVSGVKVIRDELLKVLQRHGVSLINPEPNDEFDPTKHQAVLQQQDERIEPGHIVQTLQAGYSLNDRAIRPASVSVRPSE